MFYYIGTDTLRATKHKGVYHMEAELINQGMQFVGSGAGGYFAGWGLGKVAKLVIKIVAGAVGIFFGAVMYLQSQEFLNVNWDKIQSASDNALNSIVSSDTVNGALSSESGLYHAVANIGVPVTLGFGMCFFMGLMRGIKN